LCVNIKEKHKMVRHYRSMLLMHVKYTIDDVSIEKAYLNNCNNSTDFENGTEFCGFTDFTIVFQKFKKETDFINFIQAHIKEVADIFIVNNTCITSCVDEVSYDSGKPIWNQTQIVGYKYNVERKTSLIFCYDTDPTGIQYLSPITEMLFKIQAKYFKLCTGDTISDLIEEFCANNDTQIKAIKLDITNRFKLGETFISMTGMPPIFGSIENYELGIKN